MSVLPIDAQAVPLPPRLAAGLTLLIRRSLGPSGHSAAGPDGAAEAVMAALFGDAAPAFGQVQRLSIDDLRAACAKAKVDAGATVTGIRELAELMPRIAPDTPVCDACGEIPLSNTGGKVSMLQSGARCPYCADGRLAPVPMRLKKIAWTDGRLVEPQTSHDLRVRQGDRIPLDDDDIVAWIGGWMHLGLERSLKDAGVPVYGFLAYMRLARGAFDAPHDAASLLQDPAAFGLADRRAIDGAVVSAKEFIEAREPTNLPDRRRFPFIRGADADALPRIDVAGRTYLIEGRIGGGDKADVYRGAWDHPLTERVVMKVGRDASAAGLMARETALLARFGRSSENGTPFFTRLLPEVVATGAHEGRPVTVFRYKNRYDWTLEDAIREYPGGVDPETMVWMWNRTLTLLAWVHMNRMVHGAIVPGHILIHPLNHGATLLDWAYAASVGGPDVVAMEPSHVPFRPEPDRLGLPLRPSVDIAMSARCMVAVLGGDPATGDLPKTVPGPIAEVLRIHAQYPGTGSAQRIDDALKLEKEFGKIAEGVFGPRRYHPFQMPRRSR